MSNNFSTLIQLVKVDFLGSFNTRKSKKKADVGKIGFGAVITGVVILGLVISTLYNFIFTSLYKNNLELMNYPLLLFLGVTSCLTLGTAIFKVKSIFEGKDYEMLSAMPIKKTTIIASKIISLYLVELLYSAIILIPNTVFLIYFTKNFMYLLTGIIALFFTPVVPLLLSCVVAMFISLVADRSKFGNVIHFIFYILYFALIMSVSFIFGNTAGSEEYDPSMYNSLCEGISWLNPTNMLLSLSITNNPLFLILYLAVNIGLFVGVVLVISLLFDYVYTQINTSKANEKYVQKNLANLGSKKALLKFEIKRYFGSKSYFTNTISSGICCLVLTVIASISVTMRSNDFTPEIMEFLSNYAYLGFLVIAFSIGIATPASTGISIEGANFWLIKSLPIDYKEYLKTKLKLSMIVLTPFVIVSSVVLCVLLKANWLSWIVLPVLSLLYLFLASEIGLLINLRYYKLKWKNELECVKNSKAGIITMFIDWGLTIVLAGGAVGLGFVNKYLSCFGPMTIMVVLCILLYRLITKNANKYISRIENF